MLLTIAFHALVDQAIEQRAAVIAERWAGVGVSLEAMLVPGILK